MNIQVKLLPEAMSLTKIPVSGLGYLLMSYYGQGGNRGPQNNTNHCQTKCSIHHIFWL